MTSIQVRETYLNMTFDEALKDNETFIVRIFAELFELGGRKVEHYYGDFARDVFWMQRHFYELLGGSTFYFGTRMTGTSIGFDQDEVGTMNPNNIFICTIKVHEKWGGRWLQLATAPFA